MVRDMSMKVRLVTFEALGKVGMVSEHILMQTLSKKATAATKEINYPGQYTGKIFKVPASAASFAFVHGLEDEYFEVRRSASRAMCTLTVISAQFAGEAVTLLMDVLNDDSEVVRLQVLETMHHMAMFDHLKVKEAHLHMFLGTLVDSSTSIRSTARKILRLIKLQKSSLFRLCTNRLIKNLNLYPQDEADIFAVLFKMGQNHGNYVISIIQEASEQIEPSFRDNLGFDDGKTAALLVLAISAPVSLERCLCTIPPRIYSYAAIIQGRISLGLADMVNQETLMAFLTHCSRFEVVSASKFFDEGEQAFPVVEGAMQLWNDKPIDEIFEGHLQKILNPVQKFSQLLGGHLQVHDGVRHCVNVIFHKVKYTWQFIWQGFMDEVTPTLRYSIGVSLSHLNMRDCWFSLCTIYMFWNCLDSYGHTSSQLSSNGMGDRESRGSGLTEMRYGFIGLSKDHQLHLLELVIITCALRLCYVEAFSPKPIIQILNSISCMENMHEEGSRDLPNFVSELKKQLNEISILRDEVLDSWIQIPKALEHFSVQQPVPSEDIRHKEAALLVHDNEFGKPLPFIPGLPVGIPLEIALHNISNEDRLWVRVTLEDKLTQFVFLDLQEDGECSEVRKFSFVAPFYMTPRGRNASH